MQVIENIVIRYTFKLPLATIFSMVLSVFIVEAIHSFSSVSLTFFDQKLNFWGLTFILDY